MYINVCNKVIVVGVAEIAGSALDVDALLTFNPKFLYKICPCNSHEPFLLNDM